MLPGWLNAVLRMVPLINLDGFVELANQAEQKTLDAQLASLKRNFDKLDKLYNDKNEILENKLQALTNSGIPIPGPAMRLIAEQVDRLKKKSKDLRNDYEEAANRYNSEKQEAENYQLGLQNKENFQEYMNKKKEREERGGDLNAKILEIKNKYPEETI